MPTYCNKVANFFFFFFGKGGKYAFKTKPICYKRPLKYQGCKAEPPQVEDGQTKKKGHH